MVSAVLMAGYSKREISNYKHHVSKFYKEGTLLDGYKALRKFNVKENGKKKKKPLLLMTFEKLEQVDTIDDIVIVGEKKAIESELSGRFALSNKKVTIIDQNETFLQAPARKMCLDTAHAVSEYIQSLNNPCIDVEQIIKYVKEYADDNNYQGVFTLADNNGLEKILNQSMPKTMGKVHPLFSIRVIGPILKAIAKFFTGKEMYSSMIESIQGDLKVGRGVSISDSNLSSYIIPLHIPGKQLNLISLFENDKLQSLAESFAAEMGFKIKDMPYNSICGNAIKAYAGTEAYKQKKAAFFMVCDSPLTSVDGMRYFIDESQKYLENASVVYPIVSMSELPLWRKTFHRKYLFLINDTDYQFKDSFKTIKSNRDGFRLSAYAMADLHGMNLPNINLFYSLRKALSKEVRNKIKQVLKDHHETSLWKSYFSHELTVTRTAEIGSRLMCTDSKMIIIPIEDMGSTYDFDNTTRDAIMVQKGLDILK